MICGLSSGAGTESEQKPRMNCPYLIGQCTSLGGAHFAIGSICLARVGNAIAPILAGSSERNPVDVSGHSGRKQILSSDHPGHLL